MQIKPMRWKEHAFPCFHCRQNLAEFEAVLRFDEATVNQCLCNVCINLPETIILERAMRREKKTE